MRNVAEVGTKHILVTGAAGFLGSFLCERLINDGHTVLGIDNFVTGSRQNVSHLLGHPRFELQGHDVVQPFSTAPFPADVAFDEIYNLACPASPVHYQADPVQTTKTCIYGAINVLDLARECGAKILQASTSEIYGDPELHPQPESYRGHVNTIGPRACYDEGKRCAESLFFDYHREYGLPIKVARIFNTYGPRMDPLDGRVISNFIVKALQGEDITIYGNGRQTRSFCYVDDLIDGFIKMMASPDHVTGPINLGNPEDFTMLELADLVIAAIGSRSMKAFLPLPADDPTRRQPDITIAQKELGWSAKTPLSQGLEKTIAYFEELLSGGVGSETKSAAAPSTGDAGVSFRSSGLGQVTRKEAPNAKVRRLIGPFRPFGQPFPA